MDGEIIISSLYHYTAAARSAGEFNNKAIPTSLDIAKPSVLKLHLTSINHTQIVAYSLRYTPRLFTNTIVGFTDPTPETIYIY